MKQSVVFAASFAALLLGARLAGAQPAPPSFADIDKDKNGSLSKEEVAAWLAARRAPGAGAGGQGQGAPPDPAQVFARWDTNGDGSVSKAEFDARPRPPGAGAGGPPPGAAKK